MPADLLTGPIQLRGEWHAPEHSVFEVVNRVREVCLSGFTSRSDHQPEAIWVQNNPSGSPAIWLHDNPAKVAWVYVDIGTRAWSQLAYQFGHELGHVLCNSWERDATGSPPSRWLEEALVEAFSLRGLALLSESWGASPPFAGDEGYAKSIIEYRQNIIAQYRRRSQDQGATDLLNWYKREERQLKNEVGLGNLEQAAVPVILGLIEPEPVLIEDYSALNRWPERTSLQLPLYLNSWRRSCAETGAPGRLPAVLAELLGISLR